MRPSSFESQDSDPIGSAVSKSRTARMTEHELSYMLASVARVPNVFQVAKNRLTSDLFEPAEARYTLFWRSLLRAAEAAGGLLPLDAAAAREMVAVHCAGEVASDTSGRTYTATVERSVLDPGGLLDEVYALPISPETTQTAMDLLVRFIQERKLYDPIKRALSGVSSRETLKDPQALFSIIETHARDMAGLGNNPASDGVIDAEDFVPPAPVLSTTGQRWLDEMLGGGAARQEAYVLLGPTSGGKSCMGVQLAVDGAELQSSLIPEIGPAEAGFWYIFTWELNEPQLRERVYAYAARISRNTFKEDLDPRTRRPVFSTSERPDSLKPYEHEPYVNSPGNPLMGEKERAAALRRRLSGPNSRLKLVDYSGQVPGHGTGGVADVATFLRTERGQGRKVAGVILDYAGLAVRRNLAARGLKPDAEYSLLASFVDQVRSSISVPLDCTAWVLHQLHGDVTRRSPGAKIHHSEAHGCRNFADNADFAFCMTTYHKTTGLLAFHGTKHRRAPGIEDGMIVKFDGRFGAFMDPDQAYTVDPTTKQIVPRNFLSGSVVGLAAGAAPARPNTGKLIDPRIL